MKETKFGLTTTEYNILQKLLTKMHNNKEAASYNIAFIKEEYNLQNAHNAIMSNEPLIMFAQIDFKSTCTNETVDYIKQQIKQRG